MDQSQINTDSEKGGRNTLLIASLERLVVVFVSDRIPRSIQALIRLILTQGDMFFCTIHVCLYNFSSSAELQKERKEYTNIVNVSRFLLC